MTAWRPPVAIVLAALAFTPARRARAQDAPASSTSVASVPALSLVWRAPAPCPTGADVDARFRHLVGATSKHVDATGDVTTTLDGAWSLDLATVLDGTPGRRTLKGDSCAAVAEAAALILAMMIDPLAAARATEPMPPPTPPAAPPVAPVPTIAAAAPAEPTFQPMLRAHARAFASVIYGSLPETTAAIGVGLGVTHRRALVELTGLGSRSARADSAAAAMAGGTFTLLAGGVRGCARLGGPTVILLPCVGAELERLAASGFGLPKLSSGVALVGAATAGLDVVVPIASHLSLSAGVSAAARPYRPIFTLEGVGNLWRLPAVGGLVTLGLIVII